MPFNIKQFEFIINRHESFDLSEVNRTLKSGGCFFTQQVGNRNSVELMSALNNNAAVRNPKHEIDNYANILKQSGFQIIIRDEMEYTVKFFDVGAVIFYAKACVWEILDFSVEKHFDKLCEFQKEIHKNGFLKVTGHRFMLAARKL